MGLALPSGPGKLIPRLLRDLLDYDPQRKRKNGKNLLYDPAPRYKPGAAPPIRRLERDCQHNLYAKPDQTAIPRAGSTPEPGEFYKSASFCSKCLCHFDISIDLGGSDQDELNSICELDSDYPMHHLQCSSKTTRTPEEAALDPDHEFDDWTEHHLWICSAPKCPAVVEVKIYPPRLDMAKQELLFDKDVLQKRGAAQIARDPDRYAVSPNAPQLPGEALSILMRFLKDSLDGAGSTGKRIAVRNKKFQLCFARDCDEILKWLGFVLVEASRDANEPELREWFWQLPDLPVTDLTTLEKTNRHLVQDVYYEVCQHLSRIDPTKLSTYGPLNALRDLHAIFGVLAYTSRERVIDLETEEHPFYASLGVTGDSLDELVIFAYQRQIDCDPTNKAYYFECLKDIATGRSRDGAGEKLQTEVLIAESLGQETQTAVDDAYSFFGLTLDATDQTIIGNYSSRIESAPRQADEAKSCLLIIGKSRGSVKMIELANSKKMTAEEAAKFLGIENPQPDVEDVQAAATVALLDNDKDKVVQAVKAIAEAHENLAMNLLAQELETGRKSELTLDGAYARLQCGANMPDDTILSYYQQLSNGAPAGSKQSFLEALNVIAEHRQSDYLIEKIKHPNRETKGQPDQPVGIANIGNTCYLNSLLQYFYTVRAVRDVVMNFDSYKMPLNDEVLARKKVGGRLVKKSEVIRAQEFVPLLAGLYRQLMVSPARAVKPAQDLAEMTLYSADQEEMFRRASMSGVEPSLTIAAMMNGTEPFIGPLMQPPSRPAPQPSNVDVEMTDVPSVNAEQDLNDAASDVTLVDQHSSPADVEADMTDAIADVGSTKKEPVVSIAEVRIDETMENDLAVDIAPHRSDVQAQPTDAIEDKPPMPPRRPTAIDTSAKPNKAQKLAFGAQQDVTEVIGNLMFYLQCAIKPEGYDATTGEQIDIIRDTFFGSNAVYLKKDGAMMDRKVEPWSNLIVFPDTNGPRSIYEALDVVFDQQVVEIDKADATQYASISELPPVLQIQVQRTAYDPLLQRATKNQNRIEFDETIYLDRYMDNDKVLQRRMQNSKRKAELQRLDDQIRTIEAKENNLTKSDILENTKSLLHSLQEEELDLFDDDLPDLLEQRRQELARQVEAIEQKRHSLKAIIKEDFMDMREKRYRLQAVFIHRGGGVGSGHHYVYIYDFKNLVWREYNDERVEIVRDTKRVFESESFYDATQNPATAHYLVYVQDEGLVDAVCRDMDETIVEAPIEVSKATDKWSNSSQFDDTEHREYAMPDAAAERKGNFEDPWDLSGTAEPFPVATQAEREEWNDLL